MKNISEKDKVKIAELNYCVNIFVSDVVQDKLATLDECKEDDFEVKECLKIEVYKIKNVIKNSNFIFKKDVSIYRDGYNREKSFEELHKIFIQGFILTQLYNEYINYNYTDIIECAGQMNMPLLPAFNEMVELLANLDYSVILKKQIEEMGKPQETHITGFETTLKEQQITNLYNALQNNYVDCSEEDFKAMFTDNPKPIKWIDKGTTRHEPNKQTIFEFIYLLKEYNYLEKSNFDTTASNINNLFRKLETIFPELKNFAASSGNGKAVKDTVRKKELESIIKTI